MLNTTAQSPGFCRRRIILDIIGLATSGRTYCLHCTSCNQLRSELKAWPATRRLHAAGKADSFPLEDEALRTHTPRQDISLEEPLLVNPTAEEPSHHLTFGSFGEPVPITEKGKVSIAVYNLDTRRLNEQRRRVICEMTRLLKMRIIAKTTPVQAGRREILAEISALIGCRTTRSAPYAAAARAVIMNPIAFGL